MPIYFSSLIKALLFARLVVRTISTYRKSGRLFILRLMRGIGLISSEVAKPKGCFHCTRRPRACLAKRGGLTGRILGGRTRTLGKDSPSEASKRLTLVTAA